MTADVARRAVELLEGVTEGPWEHYADSCAECKAKGTCEWLINGPEGAYHGQFSSEADARFIAASREIIPALLAERAALVEARKGLDLDLRFLGMAIEAGDPAAELLLRIKDLRALLKGAPDV